MKIGDRVKLTGNLVNPGSDWMPVEKGMEPGLEGTIVHITQHSKGFGQIKVNWDNGSGLGLFPTDPFIVLKPLGEETRERAQKELDQISSPERQKQLREEMRGADGRPTHEWERGCGYDPSNN